MAAYKKVFRPKFFSEAHRVGLALKGFHLRPVKQIKYSFDPFTNNVESIRRVISSLNTKDVLRTSVAKTKIDVRSDRSEPQIDIEFTDGHKLIFKTEHLRTSEVLDKLKIFCKEKDTAQPEADVALSKMSGKPKRRK